MASTIYTEIIEAPPEEVFDLIADVESFKDLSSIIKEVRLVGERRYRWRVEVMGMSFGWTADVVEFTRPSRFAWQSFEGTFNRGSYTLEPVEGGTRVTYEIEFRIGNTLFDALSAPLVSMMMGLITKEVSKKVRERLAADASGGRGRGE